MNSVFLVALVDLCCVSVSSQQLWTHLLWKQWSKGELHRIFSDVSNFSILLITPTHREEKSDQSRDVFSQVVSSCLLNGTEHWRVKITKKKKTPPSHLCYCKQRAGGERIRFGAFELILWMNPWEDRELSLERRESKQLLPALHGFPLNVDGKLSKGLRFVNVDNNRNV